MNSNHYLAAARDRRIKSEALDDLDYLRRLRFEQNKTRLASELRSRRGPASTNWIK